MDVLVADGGDEGGLPVSVPPRFRFQALAQPGR